MQQVHQGVTRSGIPGLFTGNFLAWSLNYGFRENKWNFLTHEERVKWCAGMGFELVGETKGI